MQSKSTNLFDSMKRSVGKKSKAIAEDVEEINVSEYIKAEDDSTKIPEGKVIGTMSFGSGPLSNNTIIPEEDLKIIKATEATDAMAATKLLEEQKQALIDNRLNTGTSTKGLTPLIDGEPLTIKRSYQFRDSTLRKLTLLKANHPDINIYINTILDAAINNYYDYIFNKGGKQ